jgi:hypothetical protein
MFDGEEYPEERPRSAASSDIRRPTRAIQMEEQDDQFLKMMVQIVMKQVEQVAAASQGQVVTERAEARQPSNRKVRAEAWRLLRVRSGAKRASAADGRVYGGGREGMQSRRRPATPVWPAKTVKGLPCKKCAKREPGSFCHHHRPHAGRVYGGEREDKQSRRRGRGSAKRRRQRRAWHRVVAGVRVREENSMIRSEREVAAMRVVDRYAREVSDSGVRRVWGVLRRATRRHVVGSIEGAQARTREALEMEIAKRDEVMCRLRRSGVRVLNTYARAARESGVRRAWRSIKSRFRKVASSSLRRIVGPGSGEDGWRI